MFAAQKRETEWVNIYHSFSSSQSHATLQFLFSILSLLMHFESLILFLFLVEVYCIRMYAFELYYNEVGVVLLNYNFNHNSNPIYSLPY